MQTMRAVVIHQAGGPEVLKLETLPVPTPGPGQALIRLKAFGLNRSELSTRQGHSPGVRFPIVPGIEATGVVEEAAGPRPWVWRQPRSRGAMEQPSCPRRELETGGNRASLSS